MDREKIQIQLNRLEQTLKFHAKGTRWLFLESINLDLLQELEYLPEILDSTPISPQPRTRPKAIQEQPELPSHQQISTPIEKPTPIKDTTGEENLNLSPLEAANLDSLRFRLRNCENCQLSQTRTTMVFGQGNQKADIVFVGEAPGGDEDRTGLAFVGKAGKLLTQIIHSIGFNREAVYICNIIKCRPPGNRNPDGHEITACSPFLYKQLEFIKPSIIVTLGNIATKTLIPEALGIMKMRGKLIDFNGTPLIPTFHPSYLLRNQSALPLVWNDMRQIRQILHKRSPTDQAKTDQQEGYSLENP